MTIPILFTVSSPNATHDSDAGILSANGRTVVTSFGWAWGLITERRMGSRH